MDFDFDSEAARAEADPRFVEAQLGALDHLGGLMDPEATAKEQFLKETTRREQERDLRANREAIMSEMRRRGVGGSGAELGMILNAESEGANRRMLEDLGTNAGAVDRAMLATEMYGDLASRGRDSSFDEDHKTRTAADDALKWGAEMEDDRDRWITNTSDDRLDAGFDRDVTVSGAKSGMVEDSFGGEAQVADAIERAGGLKVGVTTQGSQQTGQGLRDKLAALSAERAAKAYEDDDDGLFGLGIGPL
jgi:hypothetical protein